MVQSGTTDGVELQWERKLASIQHPPLLARMAATFPAPWSEANAREMHTGAHSARPKGGVRRWESAPRPEPSSDIASPSPPADFPNRSPATGRSRTDVIPPRPGPFPVLEASLGIVRVLGAPARQEKRVHGDEIKEK